ncbi:hypothetical protein HQ585_02920, partial [candidate division KSB1 bacterium]|nr:hypothetical protein [candidate division KSB1 bacterium]
AREKIAIAVLDFEAKNVNQQNAEAVADLLRTELFNTGSFKVVERAKIKKIIEELRFQMSGLTDTDQATEIGRLLNVNKIMVGSVTKLGQTYIINTRIVDVQSGVVTLAEASECRGGEEQLPTAITELALKISFKVGLEGSIIRIQSDEIYVDIGKADGVTLGQYFDVIRLGDVITDLEGRAIGTHDEMVGHILITKVQDRFSIGSVHDVTILFRKGDKVKPATEEPPAPKPIVEPVKKSEPKKKTVQKKPVKKSDDDSGPDYVPIF